MSTLRVDPAALRSFATQLRDLQAGAETAHAYLHRYGDLTFEAEGLISGARIKHEDFFGQLDAVVTHLVSVLAWSGRQVAQAADWYQRTDSLSAGQIDDTYPAAPRTSIQAI